MRLWGQPDEARQQVGEVALRIDAVELQASEGATQSCALSALRMSVPPAKE